jgi:hypothetical protein
MSLSNMHQSDDLSLQWPDLPEGLVTEDFINDYMDLDVATFGNLLPPVTTEPPLSKQPTPLGGHSNEVLAAYFGPFLEHSHLSPRAVLVLERKKYVAHVRSKGPLPERVKAELQVQRRQLNTKLYARDKRERRRTMAQQKDEQIAQLKAENEDLHAQLAALRQASHRM